MKNFNNLETSKQSGDNVTSSSYQADKTDEAKVETETVDYDRLLCAAGEFGPYQMFLFLSTFPFYVFGVFSNQSQLFITQPSLNHWCWIPELAKLTDLERRNLAIPKDDSQFGYSHCESYVANWTQVLATGIKPDTTWTTSPCVNGWEFDNTEIPYPTISSEMNWVCEKGSYQAIAQSFFYIGSIIGGFPVGWVADRFGRLSAAVFSNIIGCVAGTVTMFSRDFVEFTICRFFMGFSSDNAIMMYLLILEYISPRYKTKISNLAFAIFYTVAAVALPFVALASAHWKTLTLATSLPMALAILALFIIPESPRWLMSKGRIDETVKTILTIARVNKKTVPPTLIAKFKQSACNTKTESVSFIELLKRPNLRNVFTCICLLFLCLDIILDSLILSIPQLPFDFFQSFAIISFTEFPSLVLLSFTLDKTGRKCMMVVTVLVCAISSYMILAVGTGLPSVICAMMARFAINMSYNVCMQWAAELLPTSVRGSGTSIAYTYGSIGCVISPFVAHLNVIQPWLPMAVVGSLTIFCGIIALFLPETAGRDMPQTFEDAEDLFNNQKLFDLPCLRKKSCIKTGNVNQTFEMN